MRSFSAHACPSYKLHGRCACCFSSMHTPGKTESIAHTSQHVYMRTLLKNSRQRAMVDDHCDLVHIRKHRVDEAIGRPQTTKLLKNRISHHSLTTFSVRTKPFPLHPWRCMSLRTADASHQWLLVYHEKRYWPAAENMHKYDLARFKLGSIRSVPYLQCHGKKRKRKHKQTKTLADTKNQLTQIVGHVTCRTAAAVLPYSPLYNAAFHIFSN